MAIRNNVLTVSNYNGRESIDKVINYAYLVRRIKEGWGTEDFLDEAGISEIEFFERLQKNVPKKAYEELKRDLKRNSKNRKLAQRALTKKKQEKVNYQPEEDFVEQEVKQADRELNDLRNQEKKTLEAISVKKRIIDNLCENRNACMVRVQDQKIQVEELVKKLKLGEQILENLQQELKNIELSIENANSKKFEFEVQLERIRYEIYELDVVEIKVTSDDIVETEIDLDSDAFQEKFYYLISDDVSSEDYQIKEFAQDLTVKQLKLFAKILTIVEVFDKQKRKYKIFFDSETDVSSICELLDMTVEYL